MGNGQRQHNGNQQYPTQKEGPLADEEQTYRKLGQTAYQKHVVAEKIEVWGKKDTGDGIDGQENAQTQPHDSPLETLGNATRNCLPSSGDLLVRVPLFSHEGDYGE